MLFNCNIETCDFNITSDWTKKKSNGITQNKASLLARTAHFSGMKTNKKKQAFVFTSVG